MNIYTYERFETCVAQIFEEAGYEIFRGYGVKDRIDITAIMNEEKYAIEVKYRVIDSRPVERIIRLANEHNLKPVIVYGCESNSRMIEFEKEYSNVIFINLSNLLYAVDSNEKLKNELMSCLEVSTTNVELKPSPIPLSSVKHSEYTRNLIMQMEQCEKGHNEFAKYEDLCVELLKNIFSEELNLWYTQAVASCGMFRFDLICRIKDRMVNNEPQYGQFWKIIENYFNSIYIVFEFKNYNNKVTQKEIFMTERYLYAKSIRSVAIIFSQNEYDDNSKIAAKGCLRENGKLILLLTTKDLITMNEMKENGDEPSDYLLDKLDNFLLDIEK